jgi:hypothetical protein
MAPQGGGKDAVGAKCGGGGLAEVRIVHVMSTRQEACQGPALARAGLDFLALETGPLDPRPPAGWRWEVEPPDDWRPYVVFGEPIEVVSYTLTGYRYRRVERHVDLLNQGALTRSRPRFRSLPLGALASGYD